MSQVPLGRAMSICLVGLTGHLVHVEALALSNVPTFVLVGLPDAAVAESRDRVRAAFAASGLTWPNRRITVNLSPASLPKSGSSYDLGIAISVLAATGQIDPGPPAATVYLGELGLDGSVLPVRGVLPAVIAAARAGVSTVVVPQHNRAEAELVEGISVVAAAHLSELAGKEKASIPPRSPDRTPTPADDDDAGAGLDLAEVVGQHQARLALEIAAAGGHHLLMVGPPGAGKTMLAARMPGLLPDLDHREALEVTAVHSIAGSFDPAAGLIRRPPFEDPHHTISPAAMIGGGSGLPAPGAASRAHLGVLFMDEAPEFSPRVLQTLRQPLESGQIHLQRSRGAARFPAQFQLILAANPCPCGRAHGKGMDCTCSSLARRRYFGRLSGPLLDRIDLQVQVRQLSRADLTSTSSAEPTEQVAARVLEARRRAARRMREQAWTRNAQAPGSWLRSTIEIPGSRGWLTPELDRALSRNLLTLRGVDRVLRVACTAADLAGREQPNRDDVAQALALRTRVSGMGQ